MEIKKINSGIYLVVDPAMEDSVLLDKLKLCLKEKLAAVQIWDNFPDDSDLSIVQRICHLCAENNIPVLVNNKWELLYEYPLDGVHFDQIPDNYYQIKAEINKPFLCGLTCNNDLSSVQWANAHQISYISFCSLFPSSTRTSCELVNFDTIQQASEIANMPIFLAGGIKPDNLFTLNDLSYAGIAVVSGVMSSDRPDAAIREYYTKLTIRTDAC